MLEPVTAHIDRTFAASVERLKELLRIPSVGTDPAFDGETRRCAEHLAADLRAIGFEADARPTQGMPMVVGHWRGADAAAPHILYYGHYDVQPADPLALWESPPFDPQVVEGPRGPRIVARGAVDDKGQVMTFVEAFRAWQAVHGRLPVNVTVLIEGEEESASTSFVPFLEANADEFRADVCVVSDTGMIDVDRPAITYMLRGLVYVEVKLTGPSRDLHSGMYGGAVVNPIDALTRILGQLHDAEGRVQIPDFYDEVLEVDAAELDSWARAGFDERAFLADIGLTRSVGEAGRSVLERVWARPTCDLNGIWGGYTGEGSKTVIPSHASAKLSCRLVPDMNPAKVLAGIRRFFEERLPPDCRIEIHEHGAAPAVRVPTDSPWLAAARRALADVFPNPPALIGCGGSIPITAPLRRILGLDVLFVGFGLDDDRVHSPNEKFELACYRNGIRTHAAMLQRFAELKR
ncbi:MAG TPA: dipeptidase [Geminicoccaceae bacterium]|nr:dipeptidase [Geminicoccaceae bacterium]